MRIKKLVSRNRRDFTAIYICENCGSTEESYGYDDSNFHKNVIPKMKCKSCGETSPDNYRPLTTKYPDGKRV
jgi:primosomal protein N'